MSCEPVVFNFFMTKFDKVGELGNIALAMYNVRVQCTYI